jgi:hypothetical protein
MNVIKTPLYGFKIFICIGDEPEKVISQINRRLKKSKLGLDDHVKNEIKLASTKDNLGYYLNLGVHGFGLIWINSNIDLKNRKTMITLSHEVNHLCLDVFDFIGSEVNLQTQEPFCYLHDHMFEKCLEEIDKYGNKNTSKESVRTV